MASLSLYPQFETDFKSNRNVIKLHSILKSAKAHGESYIKVKAIFCVIVYYKSYKQNKMDIILYAFKFFAGKAYSIFFSNGVIYLFCIRVAFSTKQFTEINSGHLQLIAAYSFFKLGKVTPLPCFLARRNLCNDGILLLATRCTICTVANRCWSLASFKSWDCKVRLSNYHSFKQNGYHKWIFHLKVFHVHWKIISS